jgi:hypothetical protein
MQNPIEIGATAGVVIDAESLNDPDYMDRIITDAVRAFRDKFIMAVEAVEDNPEATFVASGSYPIR